MFLMSKKDFHFSSDLVTVAERPVEISPAQRAGKMSERAKRPERTLERSVSSFRRPVWGRLRVVFETGDVVPG